MGHDPIRVDDVKPDHVPVARLLEAIGKSLKTRDFTAKPGDVCAACEHRPHCVYAATAAPNPS